MAMKQKNADKRLRVSYIHSVPTKCFGHSCGHPRRDALKGVYYKTRHFKISVSDIYSLVQKLS